MTGTSALPSQADLERAEGHASFSDSDSDSLIRTDRREVTMPGTSDRNAATAGLSPLARGTEARGQPKRQVRLDTEVWNVEPERYAPYFRSKYHLSRVNDPALAVCSKRVILNSPLPDRGVGFGGPLSFGDGGRHIRELDRADVCRKCVPVMPDTSDLSPRTDQAPATAELTA